LRTIKLLGYVILHGFHAFASQLWTHGNPLFLPCFASFFLLSLCQTLFLFLCLFSIASFFLRLLLYSLSLSFSSCLLIFSCPRVYLLQLSFTILLCHEVCIFLSFLHLLSSFFGCIISIKFWIFLFISFFNTCNLLHSLEITFIQKICFFLEWRHHPTSNLWH